MKAASLKEIKSALQMLDAEQVQEVCMRLAKYKKENKELLTYLLFEADNEPSYIEGVKEEIAANFGTLPHGNVYYIKKSLRKILRITNRQVRYSALPQTEIELRIYFCTKMKEAKIPMSSGTVLYNLYHQQVKKIKSLLQKLPEDLQGDYAVDFTSVTTSGK
jgi:hypothetical protein